MKKLLMTMLLVTIASHAQIGTTTYLESYADIRNPERGLYYQSTSWSTAPNLTYNYQPIEQYEINDCNTGKYSLIQRLIRLDNYRNGNPIPQGFLDLIAADLAILRNAGLKCILRFVYSSSDSMPLSTNNFEPNEQAIINHITQLKTVTSTVNNEAVISSIEAGFIGKYGEWYNTSNFGDTSIAPLSPANILARTNVANKIMELTTTRLVAFRTPIFQRLLAPSLNQGKTAPFYNGSIYSRVAANNDAFMHGIDDQGTYAAGNITADRSYLAAKSKYTFTGGESNNYDPNYATCVLNTTLNPLGKSSIQQMEDYHFNYLNATYFPAIMNTVPPVNLQVDPPLGVWVTTPFNSPANGNCLGEVKRRLGYRFVLTESKIDATLKRLTISLKNLGFANVFNKRKIYLVLRNTTTAAEYKVIISGPTDGILPLGVSTEVRVWNAGGSTINLSRDLVGMTTALAGTPVQNGTYALFLELPDETLTNDPRYSIRFANTNTANIDVWESATGYNNLFKTVTITGGTISKLAQNDTSAIFHVISSPNPFTQSFKLDINTSSEEIITIKVYDMLGKLVEDRNVITPEIENLEIGVKLSAGVYNVVVKQGENEKTVRVIKN